MRHLVPLAALALLASPALAAGQSLEDYDYENLEFRGVGAEVGYILPARVEPAAAFGIRADLGYLGPGVRIVPRASFWSSRLREEEVEELRGKLLGLCREPLADCLRELGEIRVSDLVLGVDAHYTFGSDGVLPYAGVGTALHLLNGRGEAINGTFVEDLLDAIAPGVELVGGIELPFGSALRVFAEARGTLSSDVKYAGLSLGGSWRFPSPPVRGATPGGVR
ncbi:MAG TPA: outer membrane beta-barrel protein [Longimicrobiaceae bacterium]|nr:outer membrane beta-barrel protein [Longimicrobiaceae bacterium]